MPETELPSTLPYYKCKDTPNIAGLTDIFFQFCVRNRLCHLCGAQIYIVNQGMVGEPLPIAENVDNSRCECSQQDDNCPARSSKEPDHCNQNKERVITNGCQNTRNPPAAPDPTTMATTIRDAEGLLFFGKITEGTAEKGFGEFTNWRQEGTESTNPVLYRGEFKDGFIQGRGKLHNIGAFTIYEGEFYGGGAHGIGIQKHEEDGWHEQYEGEWKFNKRNGRGKRTITTESWETTVYIGDWVNNKYHGRGKLDLSCGSTYTGDFQDGNKHGTGTYTGVDGSIFVGQYKNDVIEGTGSMKYTARGIEYIGQWSHNFWNGKGTIFYGDKSVLKGHFVNNQLHGVSEKHFLDGSVVKETWIHGELQT